MRAILLTLGLISATCFAAEIYNDPTVTDPDNFKMTKISDLHWNRTAPSSELTMKNGKLMLSGVSDSNTARSACTIEGFKGDFHNHTGFYQFKEKGCHIVVTLDPSVDNNNITYSSTVRFASGSNSEGCASYCNIDGGINTLEGRYR
jgi:hypothetical protein